MVTAARTTWIDQAKGAGVLLVVYGHIFRDSGLDSLVFLFHMPMFFVLSGMLYKPDAFSVLWKKRFFSLGVPYISYLALFGPVFVLHSEGLIGLIKSTAKIMLGGAYMTGWVGVFWFVSCLVLVQLIYNTLLCPAHADNTPESRKVALRVGLLAAAGYGLTALPFHIKLPLGCEIVPIAAVFFWVGHIMANKNLLQSRKMLALSLLITDAVLCCFAVGMPSGLAVDMKFSVFGVPVLSLIIAIAMTFVFLKGVMLVSRLSFLGNAFKELGRASLVILFFHQPIRFIMDNFIMETASWSRPLFFITSVGVSYLLFRLFNTNRVLRFLFLGAGIQPRDGQGKTPQLQTAC